MGSWSITLTHLLLAAWLISEFGVLMIRWPLPVSVSQDVNLHTILALSSGCNPSAGRSLHMQLA